MLEVQKYLKSGKTLDDLNSEFGIKVARHESLPLVILNYDQIESPKTVTLVRECRGLVLQVCPTFDLVARSFSRFFNWGEVQDEMGSFDFSDFIVQSKEDGSLVVIYQFDGLWRANTRGSFAFDNLPYQNFTWQDGFLKAFGVGSLDDLPLRPGLTYVCEFCSPWNKVVRRYDQPEMYLLAVFEGENELPWAKARTLGPPPFKQPHVYSFSNIEGVQAFLREQEEKDPTFEGVVIRDRHNHRWKIKSSAYLALHRLGSSKECLFAPKNLLPFVMTGESDELFVYFPEVTERYEKLEGQVRRWYEQLEMVWEECRGIESQKDFALAVQGRTPFTGLLFNMRKHGLTDLRTEWRKSGEVILKFLK